MKIGFTGTQHGMSGRQRAALSAVLQLYRKHSFHHGCCVGADEQAHRIAGRLNWPIVLHPPSNSSKTALCPHPTHIMHAAPYLVRNRHIVNESDLLIAAPASREEELRSGTWATVRYARSVGKPVIILDP